MVLLEQLREWAPFKIDALGLVTMLGATEVDLTVGRLVYNRYTEYVPILAGFIIAGDSITKPIPGFVLYNVTDGILATDVTGWFARWLSCQDLTWNSSTLRISVNRHQRSTRADDFCSIIVALSVMIPLSLMTFLTHDWWGVTNAISMLVSVVVRCMLVKQNRAAVDRAALDGLNMSSAMVKTFWTLPSGKAVTIHVPRGVLIQCLLTSPRPPNPQLYHAARALGWLAFGCHIISLGMAALVNQIISVVVLVVATVLTTWRIGCSEYRTGARLEISRSDDNILNESRSRAYARLDLSPVEEDSMLAWCLFPQMSNGAWWDKYRRCKAKKDLKAFDSWGQILAAPV